MLGVFYCSEKGQAIAYPQDGTGRLSEIDPAEYPTLLAEAEKL